MYTIYDIKSWDCTEVQLDVYVQSVCLWRGHEAGDVIVMDGRLLHRGQANILPDSVRCWDTWTYVTTRT